MLKLGGKEVGVCLPFRLPQERAGAFMGRAEEIEAVLAAWSAWPLPLTPLLEGPPGVGKNRLVYEIARLTGKDLYVMQGTEDVTAEDLVCAVRFSDDPGRKMDYILSPLATAMHLGGICLIDEVDKFRPQALALLSSALDERRYIDSVLLGERVMAHPGFHCVVATNTTNLLPEYLQSRMRPKVPVGHLSPEVIDRVIAERFVDLKDDLSGLIACFWSRWEATAQESGPTPREALAVFGLAIGRASKETEGCQNPGAGEHSSEGAIRTVLLPEHLQWAFDALYPTMEALDEVKAAM